VSRNRKPQPEKVTTEECLEVLEGVTFIGVLLVLLELLSKYL
jgi:hypothetical protein